jgi:uncharacterized protein (TIGR04141 family)
MSKAETEQEFLTSLEKKLWTTADELRSTLDLDKEYRARVVAKLSGKFAALIDPENGPKDGEFKNVFAIISESATPSLHLPFFSRVNLNNTVGDTE